VHGTVGITCGADESGVDLKECYIDDGDDEEAIGVGRSSDRSIDRAHKGTINTNKSIVSE